METITDIVHVKNVEMNNEYNINKACIMWREKKTVQESNSKHKHVK